MGNNGTGLPPQILVTFPAPGAGDFNVQVQNVGPHQVLAVAEWLRLMAERQLNERWNIEAMARAEQAQQMAQVQRLIRKR